MADTNIEQILDALSTTVGKTDPGALSGYRFTLHEGSTALDEADDTQAFRFFEWRDTGQFGTGAPKTDSDSTWYTTVLELRIFYPKTLLIEGYPTTRGLPGLRLRDRVTLNKALMHNDPLVNLGDNIEYMMLDLVNASLSGKMMSLFYRLSWKEDL